MDDRERRERRERWASLGRQTQRGWMLTPGSRSRVLSSVGFSLPQVVCAIA